MISGMNSIVSKSLQSESVRGVISGIPMLCINQQAAILQKYFKESIQRHNDTIGNVASDIQFLPTSDMDYLDMVDAQLDLPTKDDVVLLEKEHFDSLTSKLLEKVDVNDELIISVPSSDTTSEVMRISVENDVPCINGEPWYTNEQVIDGVEYVEVAKYWTDGNNVKRKIDEAFHSAIVSDEINRINLSFVEAIASGKDDLDVILNRVRIQFSECTNEAQSYLQSIAESLSSGVSGFLTLLKNMYNVVRTGSFSGSTNTITFTNNEQYVARDFLSGVLQTFSNTISQAWNAAKTVFGSIFNVLGATLMAGYKLASNLVESLLDSASKSTFNDESTNRDFPVGLIQTRVTEEDWNTYSSVTTLSFQNMWNKIKDFGPQCFSVMWGTVYMWVNVDQTSYIYIEHKLRADIANFRCPFQIEIPVSTSNPRATTLLSNSTNAFGLISFKMISGAEEFNPTEITFNVQKSSGLTYLSVLNNIKSYITINGDGVNSRNFSSWDEARNAKYVINAYCVLLTLAIAFDLLERNSSISYIISKSENIVTYMRDNHANEYRQFYLAYSLAMFMAILSGSSYNMVYELWNSQYTSDPWSFVTGNLTLTKQHGDYPFSYYPVQTTSFNTFVQMSVNSSSSGIQLIDYQKQATIVRGSNEHGTPDPNYPTLFTFTPNVSYSLTNALCFRILPILLSYCSEYSRWNIDPFTSTTWFGCYGRDYNVENVPFWTPPKYTRTSLVSGILLVAGVVIGTLLAVGIPTLIIKHKLSISASVRSAAIESKWAECIKNPTTDNIKAYRKLVKRNNLQSKLFGGNMFSKGSYWNSPSSNADNNSLNVLSALYGNSNYDSSADFPGIVKLISGK